MNSLNPKTGSLGIAGYAKNAVLQLIVATGAAFILFHGVRVTLIVFGVPGPAAHSNLLPFVALGPANQFLNRAWTILTYGWVHNGFLEWISNMIWLFVFGNVVQSLTGYKKVIPIFIYGIVCGGLFFLLSQFIPGLRNATPTIMTSSAGIMALTGAALTLAPKYRFYLGENLGIPIMVVAGIFLALNLVSYSAQVPMLALCLGGLISGWGMIRLMKSGYDPGAWMYRISSAIGGSLAPEGNDSRYAESYRRKSSNLASRRKTDQITTQRSVDEILEKIHKLGVHSLTEQEHEILLKASKEKQD